MMTSDDRTAPAATVPLLDTLRFVAAWLRDPGRTAAVAPSGRALAALITSGIDADTGPVLELGPGTGAFTQALLARGVKPGNLTLVEYAPAFAALLKRRHPGVTIVRMDATKLDAMPVADPIRYGAVISGLGLRNMDEAAVEAVLRGAFARMRADAAFFLFTYGRRCSVPDAVLTRLDLIATHIGTTIRNLPPASVYRIARRHPGGG